jgi:hypothetical protein
MRRTLVWSTWDQRGLQHANIVDTADGVLVDGVILGMHRERPYRSEYWIQLDTDWRVRRLIVQAHGTDRTLDLRSDGQGRWGGEDGTPILPLAGCIDVDLSATPITNSLPVRRLALSARASAELLVAYVAIPDLEIHATRQRYTCLGPADGRILYRYESLGSGYSTNLAFDDDGAIADYPGTFRRIWP